jgi:hypothetical protein
MAEKNSPDGDIGWFKVFLETPWAVVGDLLAGAALAIAGCVFFEPLLSQINPLPQATAVGFLVIAGIAFTLARKAALRSERRKADGEIAEPAKSGVVPQEADTIEILQATKEDFSNRCFRIQVRNCAAVSSRIGANITAIDPDPQHPHFQRPFPLQIMNHPGRQTVVVPPGQLQPIDVFRLHSPQDIFAILGATSLVELNRQKFTVTIFAYAEGGGGAQRKFSITFGGNDRAKLEAID